MVRDVIPTENVTYDDIRDTLNANGGNVNNSAVTAFKVVQALTNGVSINQ